MHFMVKYNRILPIICECLISPVIKLINSKLTKCQSQSYIFHKDSPIDFIVMTLVIAVAKGDIKKNYCLLLFMFDDVFLKRDGSLENTYFMKILSN